MLMWSMSVHFGFVCAQEKCFCVMGHLCALEDNEHLREG